MITEAIGEKILTAMRNADMDEVATLLEKLSVLEPSEVTVLEGIFRSLADTINGYCERITEMERPIDFHKERITASIDKTDDTHSQGRLYMFVFMTGQGAVKLMLSQSQFDMVSELCLLQKMIEDHEPLGYNGVCISESDVGKEASIRR